MNSEVIDLAAIQRLLDVIGGDRDDLGELLEDFEEITPDTLNTMKESAANGDLASLRIASHSMKANSRDFGATALAKACEALELDCRDGHVVDMVARVESIATELDRVRSALKSISLP